MSAHDLFDSILREAARARAEDAVAAALHAAMDNPNPANTAADPLDAMKRADIRVLSTKILRPRKQRRS